MFNRFVILVVILAASAARAENAPDLGPIRCAWASFTPAQQERLQSAFLVDNTVRPGTLQHTTPTGDETRAAARACGLAYNDAQLGYLRSALGEKATEEVGRMGIAARGLLEPEIVDRAMEKLNEGRRREMGDQFTCPGTTQIKSDWDRSVISAMRRTGIRIVDHRTVALIALAMYALTAEEGYMRRINGVTPVCEPS